jgi:hypothetical protein
MEFLYVYPFSQLNTCSILIKTTAVNYNLLLLCCRKCGARTTTLPERGVNTYKDDEVRITRDEI